MIPMESCLENLNQHHIRLLVEGMINIPEVLLAEFKSYWDDENHYFLFDIPDESVTRDNANLNNRDINSQHSLKIVNEGTGIIKIQDI